MKVLIIDDDKGYLDLISELLQLYKIKVMVSSTLTQAQELLKNDFDKCLVDIVMPDGDGIDFIRDNSVKYKTQFYILTGALEQPKVIENLSKKSIKIAGIIVKNDLVQGLMEVADVRHG